LQLKKAGNEKAASSNGCVLITIVLLVILLPFDQVIVCVWFLFIVCVCDFGYVAVCVIVCVVLKINSIIIVTSEKRKPIINVLLL
jgi:hypothetical protein